MRTCPAGPRSKPATWAALLALAGSLAAVAPAFAQDYGITEIAGPPLRPNEAPSINVAGTVLFQGTPAASFDAFVGVGNGDFQQVLYDEVPPEFLIPPPLPGDGGGPLCGPSQSGRR